MQEFVMNIFGDKIYQIIQKAAQIKLIGDYLTFPWSYWPLKAFTQGAILINHFIKLTNQRMQSVKLASQLVRNTLYLLSQSYSTKAETIN